MEYPNDLVGLLFKDENKTLYQAITEAPRMYILRSDRRLPSGVQAVATNDPRLLKAFQLCGYEKISVARVEGIERFARC